MFRPQDAEQVAQLFHETVREINSRDYSVNQVNAWAPDNIYFRNWAKVCSERFTYVADLNQAFISEGANSIIVGFGELEPNGHIDCFYCHRHYQRQGVGSKIYAAIEQKAFELGLNRLFVEASITATSFFQRKGFSIVKQQQVICRGEVFTNYAMEKYLDSNQVVEAPDAEVSKRELPLSLRFSDKSSDS